MKNRSACLVLTLGLVWQRTVREQIKQIADIFKAASAGRQGVRGPRSIIFLIAPSGLKKLRLGGPTGPEQSVFTWRVLNLKLKPPKKCVSISTLSSSH